MSLCIPILRNHDQRQPAGYVVHGARGRLMVEFEYGTAVTPETLFSIFGSAGLIVTRWYDNKYIAEAEIIEFSLP